MKSFIEQAKNYAQYHKNPMTLYSHFIGVPLMMFAIMVLAGFFHFSVPDVFDVTLAWLGTIAVWGYYMWLNWVLGLLVLPVMVLLLWLSSLVAYAGPTSLAVWIFVITLALGVGFQLGGHLLEGNKPASVDHACHALLAPLYMVAEVCFMLGWLKDLEKKMHGKKEK